MVIIGLTGNTGAGKDTVSEILKRELDAFIVDADLIVKENQVPGKNYYKRIVELFGKKYLQKDKTLDRKLLAHEIFENEDKREKLNKLTFECIQNKLDEAINQNEDKEYIILNFPLLYEGKFDQICEFVVAVTADEDTKIKRITLRDKITANAARKRIEAQKSEEFFKTHADFIINNSININYADLKKEVYELAQKIKADNN